MVIPAGVAMAFANPLVLGGCAAAVMIIAGGAAALGAVRSTVKGALLLAVLIVAINGLVVRRGETVLFRGGEAPLLGELDITAQALFEGAVIGGRIAIVIAAFAIVSARVDPDYLLRSIRRFAGRSALTATLLVRLVPLAVADLGRLREAAELRGPGATPVTRMAMLRRLVSGTLDRAVDSAATLEVRGYGRPAVRLGRGGQVARRRFDRRFGAAALALLAIAVAARAGGVAGFDAYPATTVEFDATTVSFALTIPALAAAPFAGVMGRRA
jgi:energy-coupling factor transport system permease protein